VAGREPTRKPRAAHRPRKLDQPEYAKVVLAKLREGNSRADAAALAGITYRTLARTCQNDPDFAALCTKAEIEGKAKCIKAVMAKDPRFILERKWWREYGRRNADSLSLQLVVTIVTRLFTNLLADIPPEFHEGMGKRIESALDDLRLASGGSFGGELAADEPEASGDV
jgi:hypothetical protein